MTKKIFRGSENKLRGSEKFFRRLAVFFSCLGVSLRGPGGSKKAERVLPCAA